MRTQKCCRSYRQPVSGKELLNQPVLNRGTQFDPFITDTAVRIFFKESNAG